jgi:glycosyltransferase involved in cell wall biosynthesis
MVWRHSKGTKIDLVVTGFYSSAFAVELLRRFGKVRQTTFFLTDYLPPAGSLLVRFHRRLTGWLVRLATQWADEAWSLSPRIPAMAANPRRFIVPMHINANPLPTTKREEIGYIGNPSHDHALDILFEICKKHSFRLNLIGDSPYLQSIKHLAPADTRFHGLLNDEEKIGAVFANCFCGYAIYRNVSPSSYSYYGFPSKTLYCFASNVPVVITQVAFFNENFEKRGVGRVVEPTPEAIEAAILQLKANYATYSQAIDRFRTEWNAGAEAFHRERMSVLLNE